MPPQLGLMPRQHSPGKLSDMSQLIAGTPPERRQQLHEAARVAEVSTHFYVLLA
jgi:hypothetical protein